MSFEQHCEKLVPRSARGWGRGSYFCRCAGWGDNHAWWIDPGMAPRQEGAMNRAPTQASWAPRARVWAKPFRRGAIHRALLPSRKNMNRTSWVVYTPQVRSARVILPFAGVSGRKAQEL